MIIINRAGTEQALLYGSIAPIAFGKTVKAESPGFPDDPLGLADPDAPE